MTSIDASARHDLTDAQWALLEPLLPAPPVRGRPRRYPLRAMIDAVRWRTRVGAPWRDVPARYGPWWRAYALYRAWQLNGVWERIEAALVARADAAGKIDWRRVTSECAPTPACTGNGAIAPLRDRMGAEPGVKDTRRPPF